MAGTVQRQVTLSQAEDERLQQRARELGVTAEDLLRATIQRALAGRVDRRSAHGQTASRQEWEQVMALMRARAGLPVSPEYALEGRGWTREEIYDERLDRFTR